MPGLYAAGEVACTGAQGANRLASNSLLECLVFGARAARAALRDPADRAAAWRTVPLPAGAGAAVTGSAPDDGTTPLGERLDRDLGVEREGARLARLVADLAARPGHDAWLAGLVARAALLRDESRGAHYRADAPETRAVWRGRIHWRRGAAPRFEEVTV